MSKINTNFVHKTSKRVTYVNLNASGKASAPGENFQRVWEIRRRVGIIDFPRCRLPGECNTQPACSLTSHYEGLALKYKEKNTNERAFAD